MTANTPAENYERYTVPTFFGPWADCLLQAVKPRPGERVLDVGCGTGIVARRVAPIVGGTGVVVGLDISPEMLAVAGAAAEQANLPIAWHEGRAEALPFPSGSFDLTLSQFALMFFIDRQAALNGMHRTLDAGGRAAISVFQGIERHPFYQVLDEVIERRLGMSAVQEIFALCDVNDVQRLLSTAGFRHIDIEPVSMTARFPNPELFLAGEIELDTAAIPSMQHLDARARQEIVAAISSEMAPALREVIHDDHVVLPFHAYFAQARK